MTTIIDVIEEEKAYVYLRCSGYIRVEVPPLRDRQLSFGGN